MILSSYRLKEEGWEIRGFTEKEFPLLEKLFFSNNLLTKAQMTGFEESLAQNPLSIYFLVTQEQDLVGLLELIKDPQQPGVITLEMTFELFYLNQKDTVNSILRLFLAQLINSGKAKMFLTRLALDDESGLELYTQCHFVKIAMDEEYQYLALKTA
jgi:hypothetical protein